MKKEQKFTRISRHYTVTGWHLSQAKVLAQLVSRHCHSSYILVLTDLKFKRDVQKCRKIWFGHKMGDKQILLTP